VTLAKRPTHLQSQRLDHTAVPDIVRFDREHAPRYEPGHDLIQPAAEHVGSVDGGAGQELRRPHEEQSAGIVALPEHLACQLRECCLYVGGRQCPHGRAECGREDAEIHVVIADPATL
jgi:hypothetical protein